MISCKVVTVSSSDSNYLNTWNNLFIPDRRSLSKTERDIRSKKQFRNKSASFTSILKPISYGEFKDNLPILVKPKQKLLYRNDSVDSDILEKEINSAVLLLEFRNERDLLSKNKNKDYHSEPSKRKFNSEIKQLKMDQNNSGKAFENDVIEYKGNNNKGGMISRKVLSKCNLQMLSPNDIPSDKDHKISRSKPIRQNSPYINQDGENDSNLMISTSNSLANFITIDDISGLKESWIDKNHKETLKGKNVKLINNPSIHLTKPKLIYHKNRQDVLREYIDVYIHWRTLNAIEEHHQLTREIFHDNNSARIRTATPKQRLDQFQKIIKGRKGATMKTSSLYTKSTYVKSYIENSVGESDSDNLDFPYQPNDLVNSEIESKTEYDLDKKVEFIPKRLEFDQEARSDTYSEIDWLECEDIL